VVDYLHPEWANLRFASGSGLCGAMCAARGCTTRPMRNRPQRARFRFEVGTCRIWGIGLMPLGWAKFVPLRPPIGRCGGRWARS
jgi:hypothetical protein